MSSQSSLSDDNWCVPQNAALSADTLAVMMQQECAAYCCLDYLNRDGVREVSSGRSKMTPADRTKLADWCYELVDKCEFDRESVAIAMNIFDRFICRITSVLSNRSAQSRFRQDHTISDHILHDHALCQLVCITSLYISIKTNEKVAFAIDDLAALSRGMYTLQDIEDTELLILQGLGWRINPPTSSQFAHHLIVLLQYQVELCGASTPLDRDIWERLRNDVQFETENAVRDYYFTIRRPSTIAVAAIVNAIERADDQHYELLMIHLIEILRAFNFDPPSVLLETCERLHTLMADNEGMSIDVPRQPVLRTSFERLSASDRTAHEAASASNDISGSSRSEDGSSPMSTQVFFC